MSKIKDIKQEKEAMPEPEKSVLLSEVGNSINVISKYLYQTIPAKYYNENVKPIIQSEIERLNQTAK